MSEQTKVCTKCKKNLPLSSFSKDKQAKGGLRARCRTCKSEYAKGKYRETIQSTSSWRHAHKPNFMLYSARQRARKFNVPFNLTVADIHIPEFCPLLGVELIFNTEYAPSLDRIVPELGYVKGNVMVISTKANLMKNNASKEELVAFARNVLRLYDTS